MDSKINTKTYRKDIIFPYDKENMLKANPDCFCFKQLLAFFKQHVKNDMSLGFHSALDKGLFFKLQRLNFFSQT